MAHWVEVKSENASSAYSFAVSQWGEPGMLIPTYEPLVYRIVRILKSWWGIVDPHSSPEYYLSGGSWCLGIPSYIKGWTTSSETSEDLKNQSQSTKVRQTATGVWAVTISKNTDFRRFFFSKPGTAIYFRLRWSGDING